MSQHTTPVDKTLRIPVKLVGTDGVDLPFKGFALIQEETLTLFEKIATAAKAIVSINQDDLTQSFKMPKYRKALDEAVADLEKVWAIPQK
jgi:hypothetical protein